MFRMPVGDMSDITTPIKTKPIENQPQVENSNYIKNPISILSKITTQSARYERLIFEQIIPTGEDIPFLLSDNKISYLGNTENKIVKFSSSHSGEKTDIISGDFTQQDSFDISIIPIGRWQFTFMVKEGAISDNYFVYIVKENEAAEARLDSSVTRYTSLHVQPILDTVQNEITLSNTETDNRCPFDLKVTSDGNGSSILYIDYPKVVENDYTLSVSLNSEDLLLNYNQMVEGDGTIVKPFVIEKLKKEEQYHLQIVLNYECGGDTSLYGDIIISHDNGEDDFSFTGFVRTLDVSEYKIVPYSE